MEFSGRVQHCTSNFWARGLRSASFQGTALGQKQPVSRKSINSLSFCPTGGVTYLLETSDLGLEKIGSQILNFWGRARNIWV
jgi:hypothetical protein